ncbi:FAD-binding oxidoreductase [uncultured Roseobacter sp.]|uniref:NAD(P)/FAD-dependent oxidoreductase n=1 Tax=uncultured Roseobacter sp. TaxID=114847 RepID=UPI00263326C0|nr:FAD-binding oxidoreductase [uncultured Roseobacter sp.]
MVDITIRGAGIFGLSIAWACVQRGAKVQIIDPNGAGSGSSGGVVGALAPHVPENWNPKKAFQLDSLLMAQNFWQEVEATGAVSAGYTQSGRIQPILDAAGLALAKQRTETAPVHWGNKATWSVEKIGDDAWMPASPTRWVIRDTLSAHLHPRRACAALVAALAAQDVPITSEGKERGKVIWACGVEGLSMLNEERPRLVGNGVKGQAALLQFNAPGAAQIFADTVHIIPHLDGTVAVGSTSERDFDDPRSTDEKLDDVIEKARNAVPALKNAPVVQRWAGVRPRARSRAPMLGEWPGRTGHFIANGGFKIGFGMAPKIATVMADLVLENRNDIPQGFEVSASF